MLPIPLISITGREFDAVKCRVFLTSNEEAVRVAREFRDTQMGLFKYVPWDGSMSPSMTWENGCIFFWAMHICMVLEDCFGAYPVLNEMAIRKCKAQAKEMLTDAENLNRIKNMEVFQWVQGMLLNIKSTASLKLAPNRKRSLLKLVTLFIAFSQAVWQRQQVAGAAASN
jgi:hypothetical protein